MIKQDLRDTRKNFYDLKMQVSSNLRSNDQLQNEIQDLQLHNKYLQKQLEQTNQKLRERKKSPDSAVKRK